MKKKVNQLTKTAYHEAGHTVVAHHLRLSTHYVTIIKKGDVSGLSKSVMIPKWFNPDIQDFRTQMWVTKQIMIFYAGIITEYILTKKWNYLTIDSDKEKIVDFAIRFFGGGTQAENKIKRIKLKIFKIISTPRIWHTIVIVAQELLKKGKLNKLNLKKIFDKHC